MVTLTEVYKYLCSIIYIYKIYVKTIHHMTDRRVWNRHLHSITTGFLELLWIIVSASHR